MQKSSKDESREIHERKSKNSQIKFKSNNLVNDERKVKENKIEFLYIMLELKKMLILYFVRSLVRGERPLYIANGIFFEAI